MNIGNQSLSVPLIGTFPREASDERATSLSLEPSHEDSECDHALTFFLPAMLIYQFGICFAAGEVSAHQLKWWKVVGSIAMFAFTTVHYQRTIRSEPTANCVPLVVLPEIATVIVCGLVLYQNLSGAYVALEGSTVLMALGMIVVSILAKAKNEQATNEGQETTAAFVV